MYILYDYYEGKDKIGEYDNWHDLQKAKKEYIADTDGECDLDVEYRPEKGGGNVTSGGRNASLSFFY